MDTCRSKRLHSLRSTFEERGDVRFDLLGRADSVLASTLCSSLGLYRRVKIYSCYEVVRMLMATSYDKNREDDSALCKRSVGRLIYRKPDSLSVVNESQGHADVVSIKLV